MQQDDRLTTRAGFAALGASAGLCFWVLTDVLAERLGSGALMLGVWSFAAVFFGGLLAMYGGLRARAFLPALAHGAAVAALLAWGSLRHPDVPDFFDMAYPGFVMLILGAVPLPFILAGLGQGR